MTKRKPLPPTYFNASILLIVIIHFVWPGNKIIHFSWFYNTLYYSHHIYCFDAINFYPG